MARITIEDCLKKVPSRFELVHLAAQRVRQLREGSEYLVSSPKNEDIVVALREIAAGKITKENVETPWDMFFPGNLDSPVQQNLASSTLEEEEIEEEEEEEENPENIADNDQDEEDE